MIQYFRDKIKIENVLVELDAELAAYWANQGEHYRMDERAHFTKMLKDYFVLLQRQLFSDGTKELSQKIEAQKKRTKNFEEAQALYESADQTTIIAMAKAAEGSDTNFKRAPKGSIMHYLRTKQPDLLEKFEKDLAKSKSKNNRRGRSAERTRTRLPSKSPKSSKKYAKTPKPSRTSSRSTSSRASSKRASKPPTRRSTSRPSSASSSRASRAPSSKGKGKGKKGKGRGRGKGRGKGRNFRS